MNPKHILITGASSGLGAALALDYAAPGAHLSLHGRNSQRLEITAQQARQRGASVAVQSGDIADRAAMEKWITESDAARPIDLLIANAGISGGTAAGMESADQAAAIFAVNIGGVMNSVQPILPRMIARRQGQIGIVSSLAGFRGLPGAPAYCASKAAVRVYGEALRGMLAPHGVGVSIICPGFVKTPMTDINPFPMPFLISAAKAATIIHAGLNRNAARIAFPLPMYAIVRLLAALPQPVMDFIAARMPKKPATDRQKPDDEQDGSPPARG